VGWIQLAFVNTAMILLVRRSYEPFDELTGQQSVSADADNRGLIPG
jgi:hypothetical protein